MNESELFKAAVKLTAEECVNFLALACKDNPELLGQIEALIIRPTGHVLPRIRGEGTFRTA